MLYIADLVKYLIRRISNNSYSKLVHRNITFLVSLVSGLDSSAQFFTYLLVISTTSRNILILYQSYKVGYLIIFLIRFSRIRIRSLTQCVISSVLIIFINSLSFLNDSRKRAYFTRGKKYIRRNSYYLLKFQNSPKKLFMQKVSVGRSEGLLEYSNEGSRSNTGNAPNARYTASVIVNPVD